MVKLAMVRETIGKQRYRLFTYLQLLENPQTCHETEKNNSLIRLGHQVKQKNLPNIMQHRIEPCYKITSQPLSCTIRPGYFLNYFRP